MDIRPQSDRLDAVLGNVHFMNLSPKGHGILGESQKPNVLVRVEQTLVIGPRKTHEERRSGRIGIQRWIAETELSLHPSIAKQAEIIEDDDPESNAPEELSDREPGNPRTHDSERNRDRGDQNGDQREKIPDDLT